MRKVVLVLSLVLSLSHTPAYSATPPQAGSICSKQGITKTYKGEIYKCKKVKGKLVWSKGKVVKQAAPVASPSAIPSPSPTTTPTPNPSQTLSTGEISNQICPKENEVVRNSVGEFWCQKSNDGQLRWAKNNIPQQSKPTPQSTPTKLPSPAQTIIYSPPTVKSDEIKKCKIEENNQNRRTYLDSALPTGFPSITRATKMGTVKWAIIPLDFPDLPGEVGFRSRVDEQMKKTSDWFEVVSEGKFKVDWRVAENWIRLPKLSKEYQINYSDNIERVPNVVKLWNDAMLESDKVFDFTGIQTVNFILPKGQEFVLESAQGFPWQPEVKSVVTNEGSVSSFSIAGRFFDSLNREYWSYWVHEFGHAMALPHVGSSRIASPFMGLDIMGSQDGESKELSGWLRFVAGWLDDQKVFCKEFNALEKTDVTLVPLSEISDGIKMVVVPVSKTKAVIIESRRETKFSCQMPSLRNGVLVYTYDATFSHNEDFFKPIVIPGREDESSSNCPVARFPNPILYESDAIVAEGIKIEVLVSANFDKIRISRN